MNDIEFRAVLDWRMCSDPWPDANVPITIIDDWLHNESQSRGYEGFVDAFHKHLPEAIHTQPRCDHGFLARRCITPGCRHFVQP